MHIQHVAYNKYMTDWMLSHGYTLHDYAVHILSYCLETLPDSGNNTINQNVNQWEMDAGFGGMLYASFREFLDNEFKDEDYMRQLLTTDEFMEWMEYWNNKQ